MRRILALTCIVAFTVTGCGGRDQAPNFPESYPRPATELDLPDPMPAVPAFLALMKPPAADRDVKRIARFDGVAIVTQVRLTTITIKGERVTVGAVDPVPFRSVAPSVTRDAEFVWSALLAGNAVVSFDAARELGLEGDSKLEIDGDPIEIGAFADSGSPRIADVLIDRRLADELKIGGRNALMIGARSVDDRDGIARRLQRTLGERLTRLLPQVPEVLGPEDPEPNGTAQGGLIGRMNFEILDDGFVKPDPNWVAANIVTADVPILGRVLCHRLMVPQMASALAEIERAGLADLIDSNDYGGCYVPRFISRDPKRALSMHAFGLAFDINVQTNLYGSEGQLDRRVVEVLQSWGFEWGGDWDPPDPMHFELDRLIQPSS
ncbi:MAG: hypothetical protein GEU78_03850 [Actinobacteria bacterium]|nr:hypothetical protein [Actinomycetota bacterium]